MWALHMSASSIIIWSEIILSCVINTLLHASCCLFAAIVLFHIVVKQKCVFVCLSWPLVLFEDGWHIMTYLCWCAVKPQLVALDPYSTTIWNVISHAVSIQTISAPCSISCSIILRWTLWVREFCLTFLSGFGYAHLSVCIVCYVIFVQSDGSR